MSDSSHQFDDLSLAQLFRLEAEGQVAVLTHGLLALERDEPTDLEELLRAAHSLKGAARIVGANVVVQIAHAMEDCFVAVQRGEIALGRPQVEQLLVGVDLLTHIAHQPDAELGSAEQASRAADFVADLKSTLADAFPRPAAPGSAFSSAAGAPVPRQAEPETRAIRDTRSEKKEPGRDGVARRGEDRVLRVTAEHLNRLLGLAGESMVESRRLRPFSASVARLKKLHQELAVDLDRLRDTAATGGSADRVAEAVGTARERLARCRDFLAARIGELEAHDRRAGNLAHRLYEEALAVRMRPFADGLAGFPRMVRDVARQLEKDVRLEIVGEDTQVDRDILDQLEAPLGHLLRNAVDHGIERPTVREAAGKPPTGTIRLEARHSAGVLLVSVSDDGKGVDPEVIREAVVRKKLVAADTAPRLSEAELLEFLFLPGFSLKDGVTEISGRGVGLDVVQSVVKAVRGTIRVSSRAGQGMRFQLQLPLTLSVVRALLVSIAEEPYAIPLGLVVRTLRLSEPDIASTEGKEHFSFDGRRVGLVTAHQVLGRRQPAEKDELAVVVMGDAERRYGLVVDDFLGERELVVQPLDRRLGKIKDVAAGALMEDGTPVLILDVGDLLRSVERIAATGQVGAVQRAPETVGIAARKRVLVVDDSLTVRELERKLLESRGYEVEVSVDGMDGWNAARAGAFDLVITDVDMPRLDGIELTRLIKGDAKLRDVPVMIVSYKDREEDRRRGLDAGADYYLTKGSFHDDTMLDAVAELIGNAREAAT